ncbi:MAG TPA: EscU/YscU/HrcU family type III secretion system export apparatus switch protein [Acidimicrobiales bacterium]
MPVGDKHSKTEKPTPKRRREARRRGQVARSADIGGWAAVLVGSLLLPWYFGTAERKVVGSMTAAANVMAHPTTSAAVGVLGSGLLDALEIVLPLGAVMMALGVALNVAQVGPGFSFEAARPRWSRVNPVEGIKRLFSPNTLWELVKQLLKLAVLAAVAYRTLDGALRTLTGTAPVGLGPIVGYLASSVLGFVRVVALLGLGLGAADYAVQRHRLTAGLKMTKAEVKDERRQQEGDPATKGELRKRSYAIARSKMMAAVKTADVVVANPTHYSVALQYRPQAGSAPRVLAKGVGPVALRIRDEAARHRIPVVEDAPLARYLYAVCGLDEQIPPELYLVVAKLLAFVFSLPANLRTVVQHPVPSVLPTHPTAIEHLSEVQRARVERVTEGAA